MLIFTFIFLTGHEIQGLDLATKYSASELNPQYHNVEILDTNHKTYFSK